MSIEESYKRVAERLAWCNQWRDGIAQQIERVLQSHAGTPRADNLVKIELDVLQQAELMYQRGLRGLHEAIEEFDREWGAGLAAPPPPTQEEK